MKMLKLDWVYQWCQDRTNFGFAGLNEVLENVPDSVLASNLARTLVEHMYDKYLWLITWRRFIPYTVYFISTTTYFSYYVIDEELRVKTPWTPERIVNLSITVIGILYFVINELRQVENKGSDYFTSLWNYFENGSLLLNAFILCLQFFPGLLGPDQILLIIFIAVGLMWA